MFIFQQRNSQHFYYERGGGGGGDGKKGRDFVLSQNAREGECERVTSVLAHKCAIWANTRLGLRARAAQETKTHLPLFRCLSIYTSTDFPSHYRPRSQPGLASHPSRRTDKLFLIKTLEKDISLGPLSESLLIQRKKGFFSRNLKLPLFDISG